MIWRALVDSQVALWAITNHKLIGKNALAELIAAEYSYASLLSIAELEMKLMAGVTDRRVDVSDLLIKAGFELYGVDNAIYDIPKHPELDGVHPFDRIIFCQAKELQATLFTVNKTIINLGLDWVVDARV
jgi:PIN domain nuclease of toxin-antitoxin system